MNLKSIGIGELDQLILKFCINFSWISFFDEGKVESNLNGLALEVIPLFHISIVDPCWSTIRRIFQIEFINFIALFVASFHFVTSSKTIGILALIIVLKETF